MLIRRTLRSIVVAASAVLLGTGAASAQEVLSLEDQGRVKKFVLLEDEVLLESDNNNPERLKGDIEAALPGATVIETRSGEALTRLPQRVDRRKAAARQAPIQQAAPQFASSPVLYHQDLPRMVSHRRYVGPRVLVALPDGKTIDQLKAESGAMKAEVSPLAGHALLTFRDGWQSLSATEDLVARGLKARPLLRRYVDRMWVPNDPFVHDQWHIKNRGQSGGLIGADANLFAAWDMARGAGVTVVVVDDSLETTHPDLAPNTPQVNTGAHHRDFRSGGNNPSPKAFDDAHGTSVAGVIAAKGNNGIGVSGAAPDAELLGVRLIGGSFDQQTAYDALTWQPPNFTSSVSNNSWGYYTTGMVNLDPLERQALVDAATTRRGGLGQITLFAAGNNDEFPNGNGFTSQDVNYQPFANSRFVIAVGACTNFGDHSYYSNRGAALLICAPSNGGSLGIFTADNVGPGGYNSRLDPGGQPGNNHYTNSFGGTSSATPLTSGIVALMLSANPGLGYRDVMEILATTARKIDAANPDWVTNGAGFDFAHAYGAGMVNAAAAVARSTPGTWTNLPAAQSISRPATGLPANIPDNSTTVVSRNFDFPANQNLRVEHVEVVISATHPNRSDLEIAITSPSGTRSILNPFRVRPNLAFTGDDDRDLGSPGNGWVFMTTHHWGENSTGTWVVTARDRRAGSIGSLNSVEVRVFGTPAVTQRVRFAQKAVTVDEDAGTVNIVVQRIGPATSTAQVGYAVVGGSATSSADFTLANGTVNFGAGETQKNIQITINDDLTPEAAETIFVALTNPQGAALGGGTLCTLTIAPNDGNFVTITALDSTMGETENGPANTGQFAVTRVVADDLPLTVNLRIEGSAVNGVDTVLIPTTVIIPSGLESATFTITPLDDSIFEGSETIKISLEPSLEFQLGEPDEATFTLLDNEIPKVSLFVDKTSLSETGTQTAKITVTRDAAANTPMVVDLFVAGSAQPGGDYVELPSSVIIPENQDRVELTVQPIDNEVFNITRTVVVKFDAKPDYTPTFNDKVEILITNDEPSPDPTKPTVSISTPRAKARFDAAAPNLEIGASGVAKDNIAVDSVQFRLNGAQWLAATMDTDSPGNWSAELAPHVRPGPNLLEVRSKDGDGNFSKIAARPLNLVKLRNLTVTPVGPGSVSPAGGSFEAGQVYSLKAKPQSGMIFSGWSGDLSGSGKTLTFTMPDADTSVTATFVANPFVAAITGRYTGLVSGPTSLPSLSGMLDVTVTKAGAFSGKLWYAGAGFSLRGELNGAGKFAGSVKRGKGVPLAVTLSLNMDPAGPFVLTGTVDGEAQTSAILATRAVYDAKKNPLNPALARAYTFYLPVKSPADASKPRGYGVGTMTVSTGGAVKWAGMLGDGTKVSQSTVLDAQNTWPLYLSLYKGGGYISGEVAHDSALAGSDFSASLNWVKPAVAKEKFFPDGFTIEGNELIGVDYTAPARNVRVLAGYDTAPANAGPVTLVDGNLTNPGIAKTLTLLPTNATSIAPVGNHKLKVSISAKTGAVKGSFVFPITRKVTPITGVILQNKIGKGVGLFPGSTISGSTLQTGRLDFAPAP